MASNILMSVYALAKSNNGFFKSEKQAAFLSSALEERDGYFVELFSFGYHGGAKNTRTVYVKWDQQGITEIKTVADISKKETIKFTRLSADQVAANKAKAKASRIKDLEEMAAAMDEYAANAASQKQLKLDEKYAVLEAVKAHSDKLDQPELTLSVFNKDIEDTANKYDQLIAEYMQRKADYLAEIAAL